MNFLKQFFVFDPVKSKTVKGKCKLCHKEYSDKVGSTGNFHKHLRRKHTDGYAEAKQPTFLDQKSDVDDDQSNQSDFQKKTSQSIATQLIVRCNMPPALIEYPGFRNFMVQLAPKWKPTSARYMKTNLLPSLSSSIRTRIELLLADVDHLTITVDVWTNRSGKAFLGITGHFIDLDFAPQAILLDFVRLRGPHTGDNIRNVTEEILDKLEVRPLHSLDELKCFLFERKLKDKVYRIVTDNASSMIKAYKFGLAVTDDDFPTEEAIDQEQVHQSPALFNDEDDIDAVDEWTLIDSSQAEDSSFENEDDPRLRLSCFAHSLQLAIRDGLKDAPYLAKSLAKCIRLASKTRKSTKVADLLEVLDKRINRSNVTRWSSEYLLIKSVVEMGKKSVDEITSIVNDDQIKFTNTDFIVLQEAIDILEPFTEITLRIQSESVVTISLVVPSIVHLLDHLNAMKSSVTYLKKLISQLESAINKRFAGIVSYLSQQPVSVDEPYSDPIYFVASVLDPQFKLHWLQQMKYNPAVESKMKQLLIQTVLNECEQTKHIPSDTLQSHTQYSSSSSRTSSSSVSQSGSGPAIKRRKLFYYENGSDSSFDSKLGPIDELNAFLTDPVRSKFPLYWKSSSFSLLKSVVRRVFSVQASSAPVERAFSQAGLILSPKRTSMLTELFQTLVFLRVNQKLL